ncbi:hypothetical protein W124_00755, partial [Staphylococcus aureus DAR3567]
MHQYRSSRNYFISFIMKKNGKEIKVWVLFLYLLLIKFVI